jgi:FAD:protein FMN transferase
MDTPMTKWLLLILFFSCSIHAQLKKFSFSQPKMGSYFTIVFYDKDSLHATKMANECFELVDSLNEIYSDYIPGSELNRLSSSSGKGEWVSLSASLLDILLVSQSAWKLSRGAFDITIGPIVRLWRKARKDNRFPDKDSLAGALKATGFQYILIDSIHKRVQLMKPGMRLDLGGIAQGYMAQKVLNHLQNNQINSALIDASGDIVMGDAPPDKDGWRIAVNLPESTTELMDNKIVVHNKAVITSGDVYQYMIHDGKRYSHIVDPRTGYGVTNQRNATVITDDGVEADWLATASTILSIKQIRKLTKKLNAGFLIGVIKKGKLVYYKNKNFERHRAGMGNALR